jgi:hypothetical protein
MSIIVSADRFQHFFAFETGSTISLNDLEKQFLYGTYIFLLHHVSADTYPQDLKSINVDGWQN